MSQEPEKKEVIEALRRLQEDFHPQLNSERWTQSLRAVYERRKKLDEADSQDDMPPLENEDGTPYVEPQVRHGIAFVLDQSETAQKAREHAFMKSIEDTKREASKTQIYAVCVANGWMWDGATGFFDLPAGCGGPPVGHWQHRDPPPVKASTHNTS